MSAKNINALFNKLRGQKNDDALRVSKGTIGSADERLIMDESDQPGWWSRFLIGQAGGYHPQYYKKDEVEDTTRMAVLKFASVSLATYSFTKAVSPALNSDFIQSLPSVYDVDPKIVLMGTTAGVFWWGLSELDKAVLHNMRSHKAAVAVAEKSGVSPKRNGVASAAMGVALRYGVSIGSLAITIPALLVTVAEGDIDEYQRAKIKENYNNPIIEEYQTGITKATTEIGRIDGLLTQNNERLLALDTNNSNLTYTEEQLARRKSLNEQLASIEAQIEQQESSRLQELSNIDQANARIKQEREGTRNSIPGCRPEVPYAPMCDAAMADRDDALARLKTINEIISDLTEKIGDINSELSEISRLAQEALRLRKGSEETLRTNIQLQIDELELSKETQEKFISPEKTAADLAQEDPRWVDYNPALFDRVAGFQEYMQKEANFFQWLSAGAIALIITSMELGVFTLAASRKASPGEIRGYRAQDLRSAEAERIYQKEFSKNNLEDEVSLDPIELEIRNRRKLVEAQEEARDRLIRKAMEEAGIEKGMYTDIVADLQEIRYKRSYNMNDVPQPDATVYPENREQSSRSDTYKPDDGAPRPGNMG